MAFSGKILLGSKVIISHGGHTTKRFITGHNREISTGPKEDKKLVREGDSPTSDLPRKVIQITLHVRTGLPSLLLEAVKCAKVVFMNGLEGGSREGVGSGVINPGLPVGKDGVDLGGKAR